MVYQKHHFRDPDFWGQGSVNLQKRFFSKKNALSAVSRVYVDLKLKPACPPIFVSFLAFCPFGGCHPKIYIFPNAYSAKWEGHVDLNSQIGRS